MSDAEGSSSGAMAVAASSAALVFVMAALLKKLTEKGLISPTEIEEDVVRLLRIMPVGSFETPEFRADLEKYAADILAIPLAVANGPQGRES